MINHKFYRLTEDFQTGYLLLQYAYMPYGAQPGDCDWRSEPWSFDEPQQQLRVLLSELSDLYMWRAGIEADKEGDAKAARHVEATMTRDRDELNSLKSRYNTLGTAYGQLKEAYETLSNTTGTLHTALTEANNQRSELRSQLVTAQKAADSNPLYMSAMERDNLLVQLDEMLREIGTNNTNNLRTAAVTLIRRNAVPMRLLSIQPTLAECGNLMRAMLYMYYGGHQETAFNEEDKTRARKLMKFIDAAKA